MNPLPDGTGMRDVIRDHFAARSLFADATATRRAAVAELKQTLETATASAFAEWHEKWGTLPDEVTVTMLPVAVYGGPCRGVWWMVAIFTLWDRSGWFFRDVTARAVAMGRAALVRGHLRRRHKHAV